MTMVEVARECNCVVENESGGAQINFPKCVTVVEHDDGGVELSSKRTVDNRILSKLSSKMKVETRVLKGPCP